MLFCMESLQEEKQNIHLKPVNLIKLSMPMLYVYQLFNWEQQVPMHIKIHIMNAYVNEDGLSVHVSMNTSVQVFNEYISPGCRTNHPLQVLRCQLEPTLPTYRVWYHKLVIKGRNKVHLDNVHNPKFWSASGKSDAEQTYFASKNP